MTLNITTSAWQKHWKIHSFTCILVSSDSNKEIEATFINRLYCQRISPWNFPRTFSSLSTIVSELCFLNRTKIFSFSFSACTLCYFQIPRLVIQSSYPLFKNKYQPYRYIMMDFWISFLLFPNKNEIFKKMRFEIIKLSKMTISGKDFLVSWSNAIHSITFTPCL